MLKLIFVGLVSLSLASCGMFPPSGDCGAEGYQDLIGKSALEYVKALPEAEPWVKNNSHFIGDKEAVDESFPRQSVMVELNVDEVHSHEDLMGARIKRIYCLGAEEATSE